ncbi:3'-5' exonuclease [Staphylococcus chromogenes]|uniref:3'-5' exonuclease n=1 Tax=Staphylococcus chromogenes TaxID=46126 RepID=UPI0029010943|nr:exonuclease domain-containing protein [Staphylococcus chromogenes]MDU0452297.1 exonuclease domain-containing protein [Staphylococcus chromogenes]
MKKVLYCIILAFSLLVIFGGLVDFSENGTDFLDFILFFIFISLCVFCVYKLIIDTKKKKSEVVQKEKVESTESYESDRQIELLNEKLKLKEDYIKQLEQENNLKNSSKDEHRIVDNKLTNSYEPTPLDLTYTKARKIDNSFVVLDFETTGLKYDDHEIIQYGVVEFKDGIIVNEFTQYFKPDKPVGKTVMRKTGITNEFLEDKPKISHSHLEELKGLLEGNTIIAHNASFDMKFLLKNLHNFNIPHKKFRVFDTLTASRRLIHETPNHKLETLKNHFNLDDGNSHEALNDARATGKLALLLIERM